MASATAPIAISKLPSPSAFSHHRPPTPSKLSVRAAGSQKAGARSPQLAARASSPAPAKEKAIAGLAAASLVAAMVIPEMAEAAQPGISPSLKNFLLSIVSGGVVLGVIVGAVIGVSNFDPVKRT